MIKMNFLVNLIKNIQLLIKFNKKLINYNKTKMIIINKKLKI